MVKRETDNRQQGGERRQETGDRRQERKERLSAGLWSIVSTQSSVLSSVIIRLPSQPGTV